MGDDVLRAQLYPGHGTDDGEGMLEVPAIGGLRESSVSTGRDTQGPRVRESKV